MRLSLVLLLAFALAVLCWRPDFSSRSTRTLVKKPVVETAATDDGFRPIPQVEPPDDNFRPAVPASGAGAAPVSEAMRNLASRMSRESEDLQVVTHPDGRRSVDLGGRFMHMSAVVSGADGKPEVRCFSNDQEMTTPASQSLKAPVHVR
jgi:hypothetical protein